MSQESLLVEGQLPTFQQYYWEGVPYDEQVNICKGPEPGGVPIAYVSQEGRGLGDQLGPQVNKIQ